MYARLRDLSGKGAVQDAGVGDYLPYVEAVPAYNIVRSQYHPKALVPYHQGQANLQEVLTRSLKGAGIDAQVMKLP